MTNCLESKDCKLCKTYKDSIELLKNQLRDKKLIYEDSIKVYMKALTDREYELLMRECEVVKEMDDLKSVIAILTQELENRGAKVTIDGTTVSVKDGNNVSKKGLNSKDSLNVDSGITSKKKVSNSRNVKPKVKENVKEKESKVETDKVKVKENVKPKESKGKTDKAKVKEKVKKQLKPTNGSLKINDLGIILPYVNGITEDEATSLLKRGESILDCIKTAKVYKKGVSYPCRRLTLVKKHPEFFVSMLFLVESTPKARGSYAWTRVTNILKECDDYNELASNFLNDMNLKLTYLNVRNWYSYIIEVLDGKEEGV